MTGPRPLAGRRLARLAGRSGRSLRLRLVDAVALAAGGLLVMKLTALLLDGTGAAPPPPGAPLPDFARALAGARTGYAPVEPTTTGSVSPKEKPSDAGRPKEAGRETRADTRGEASPLPPATSETVSPTEQAILEKLSARRDALKARSDALDLREQMLNDAERKLETGIGDLRQAEERTDGGAGGRKGESERTGLKGIVTMYETMKPKDAARVFDRLTLDVLVPLVLAMNPRKMAEILAVMGPEPAERLTVALANRARGIEASATPAGPGLPPNELPALDPGPPTRPALH